MSNPPPQLDPITVGTAVIAMAFGPQIAQLAGPYAVIAIAASTGAGWALSRREPGARSTALWFMLRINASALLLTWGLAELAQSWWPVGSSLWWFPVVALGIGAVGDDWPAICRWAFVRARRAVERRIDSGDNTP